MVRAQLSIPATYPIFHIVMPLGRVKPQPFALCCDAVVIVDNDVNSYTPDPLVDVNNTVVANVEQTWLTHGNVSIVGDVIRLDEHHRDISSAMRDYLNPDDATFLRFSVTDVTLSHNTLQPPDAFEVTLLDATWAFWHNASKRGNKELQAAEIGSDSN